MIICNLLFILHAIKLIMIYYNNNNLKNLLRKYQ